MTSATLLRTCNLTKPQRLTLTSLLIKLVCIDLYLKTVLKKIKILIIAEQAEPILI